MSKNWEKPGNQEQDKTSTKTGIQEQYQAKSKIGDDSLWLIAQVFGNSCETANRAAD